MALLSDMQLSGIGPSRGTTRTTRLLITHRPVPKLSGRITVNDPVSHQPNPAQAINKYATLPALWLSLPSLYSIVLAPFIRPPLVRSFSVPLPPSSPIILSDRVTV